MIKRFHSLLTLFLCLLVGNLGGCVTQAKKPAKPVIESTQTTPTQQESIYSYISSISTGMLATPEAQKKEVLQLNQHLVAAVKPEISTVQVRMKLAVLYGLPNSRVRDPLKAQNLLDQLLREPSLENDHRVLLGLLRDYVMDTAKLNTKIRDEQKRADAVQSRLDSTQQRADSLQRKLDELKNIEKTMIDRGQGTAK